MGDPLDAHGGHRGARQRREKHAAERVAECVAETAIERLDHELAAVVLNGLGGDSGNLEVEHLVLTSSQVLGSESKRRLGRGAPSKAGSYFEYSSTMSCSCTGAAISARSGLRSTFAVSWS